MQTQVDDAPVCADTQLQIACARARIEPDSDAGRTLAFRRSLRRSHARRAAAALRRRRTMHSRGSAIAVAAGLFILSAGAIAQSARNAGAGLGADTIATAQRALGVDSDGVIGPRTRGATKRFQRSKGLTVDGIIGPQTLKALGVDPDASQTQAASTGLVLQRIARCESGGDPTAVSASGRYRGKYQFDLSTWRSIGGRGDPAAAREVDQDALASKLLAREGTSPWPRCA
jgi:hypothetical protein